MGRRQGSNAYGGGMSRAGFFAAWAAATLVATLLAFAAVSFVAGDLRTGPQVLGTIAAPVPSSTVLGSAPGSAPSPSSPSSSAGEVETSVPSTVPSTLGSTSPTTTAPAPSVATSTTVAAPSSDSTVVATIGGSAGISCSGDVISLDWYAPSEGFKPDLEHGGPGEVELKFENEKKWESRIHADCNGGKVVADVEEHDESD